MSRPTWNRAFGHQHHPVYASGVKAKNKTDEFEMEPEKRIVRDTKVTPVILESILKWVLQASQPLCCTCCIFEQSVCSHIVLCTSLAPMRRAADQWVNTSKLGGCTT